MANMSHELRTPLSGIMGLTDVLMNRLQDLENLHHARLIKESARALNRLLDEVLDLAKIDQANLSFSARPLNVCREIDNVVGLFREAAGSQGTEIRSEPAPDTPRS